MKYGQSILYCHLIKMTKSSSFVCGWVEGGEELFYRITSIDLRTFEDIDMSSLKLQHYNLKGGEGFTVSLYDCFYQFLSNVSCFCIV